MTVMPLPCSRATVSGDVVNRSMSYIFFGFVTLSSTVSSIVPLSCHCQLVPGVSGVVAPAAGVIVAGVIVAGAVGNVAAAVMVAAAVVDVDVVVEDAVVEGESDPAEQAEDNSASGAVTMQMADRLRGLFGIADSALFDMFVLQGRLQVGAVGDAEFPIRPGEVALDGLQVDEQRAGDGDVRLTVGRQAYDA